MLIQPSDLLPYRSGHEAKIEIIALFDCSSPSILAVRTEKDSGGEGKGIGSPANRPLALRGHVTNASFKQ